MKARMNLDPLVSVIVPVYNVEKYLAQCLDSIRAQTLTGWECIIIDDGSTDSCPAICDSFAAADARFRVIHTENGGLSAARNVGLRNARGSYIAFVDSDDWVDPDFLQSLLGLIEETGADVAQVGIMREYVGASRPLVFISEPTLLRGHEIFSELVRDRAVRSYVCNKMYRRELLDVEFPEGRKFEDMTVQDRWLADARLMALSPRALYHYRMRGSSILHSNVAATALEHQRACAEREQIMRTRFSGVFSSARCDAYRVQVICSDAKNVARLEPDSRLREEALAELAALVRAIPDPGRRLLGAKLWLRSMLLRRSVVAFIAAMRLGAKSHSQGRNRRRRLYS